MKGHPSDTTRAFKCLHRSGSCKNVHLIYALQQVSGVVPRHLIQPWLQQCILMSLAMAGSWTRWPFKVPSTPNHSMILCSCPWCLICLLYKKTHSSQHSSQRPARPAQKWRARTAPRAGKGGWEGSGTAVAHKEHTANPTLKLTPVVLEKQMEAEVLPGKYWCSLKALLLCR